MNLPVSNWVFQNPIIEYIWDIAFEYSDPKDIGHMGVEYNNIGEECEWRNASQREKIHMGWKNTFYTLSFSAWGASREQ